MSWMQTLTNRKMDFSNPVVTTEQLFAEIPEALGKAPRFAGHNQGGPYSVAQHCVLGADYLLKAPGGGREAAAAFLLHDAHEAYLGDIPTPVAIDLCDRLIRARGIRFDESMPGKDQNLAIHAAKVIRNQFLLQKQDLDRAIYGAAGIEWPLPPVIQPIVSLTDIRMLATERRHLLGPAPEPWSEEIEQAAPIRFSDKIVPWAWDRAADEYRQRLKAYLPKQTIAALAA